MIVLADKGLAGKKWNATPPTRSKCCRSGRTAATNRAGMRQWIEPVYDTVEGQARAGQVKNPPARSRNDLEQRFEVIYRLCWK